MFVTYPNIIEMGVQMGAMKRLGRTLLNPFNPIEHLIFKMAGWEFINVWTYFQERNEEGGPVKTVYQSSRELRFLSFASVEYEGHVYMTPQDFLESVMEEAPRRKLLLYIYHWDLHVFVVPIEYNIDCDIDVWWLMFVCWAPVSI